ncbi:GNAT family N-acetyltransferase [Nubsella zeaxanthinifaciens]|jgi:ribosomal-protein-alanine N-acetyltransferase|uniref:GNAT family N-acetyltransferase n=1 Tax=Nubsella zeaxanthinifaciens TaxID=392412 RepID=UPI000DE30BB8|nr:GNAT family N-acetyltransferase [Nubsella zeaxanthinifaciens]
MLKQPLETERFWIRELNEQDVDGMFELDSNPNVHAFLWKNPIKTKEEALQTIRFIQQQYIEHGIGRWAIIDKQTNEFVGWTGFKFITTPINGHVNFYDVGYRLIERYWEKGVATETTRACLSYGWAHLKLTEVYGMCHIDNLASKNVLQKCGLKLIEKFILDEMPCYWFKTTKLATANY